MPKISTAEPVEFEPDEIDDFVSLVLAGGEVTAQGLRHRVVQAEAIAFLREKGALLGVAGLKRPSVTHRADVVSGSRTKLDAARYPFELGWVFILPAARNRGLSFPLCQPLLTAAKGIGVFATSRVSNEGMHRTLQRLGFRRTGGEWASKQNDEELVLFLKAPTVERTVAKGAGRAATSSRSRHNSDEQYIVSLCDEVLGRPALRQHTFEFLRGDPGKQRQGKKLPVDAYYPELKLVVEYQERQHTEAHAFFDKPGRMTVSNVHRGEQRALYTERRKTALPQHGITLVEMSVSDFDHDSRSKLLRKRDIDLAVVRRKLERWHQQARTSK